MTPMKYVFRQDASCLRYAALGDTAVRVIAIHHLVRRHGLDAVVVPQPNSILVPLWTAAFGIEKVVSDPARIPESHSHARICRPTGLDWAFGSAGWTVFETVLWENGFFDTQQLQIIPPILYRANHQSRRVMIYPVEHTDGNRVLNSDWWIQTCSTIKQLGWGLNLLGSTQHEPLRELFARIAFDEVFPPTIDGLRNCVGASAWAIGGSTGPSWVLLMSDIPQIVVETKRSPHGYWHFDRCQHVLVKRLRIVTGVDGQLPLSSAY